MIKARKKLRIIAAVMLTVSLPFTSLTANVSADSGAPDITVNHADSLSRLFVNRPDYCLYCSKAHPGFAGFFVRLGHEFLYLFRGLFGDYDPEGRVFFTYEKLEIGADEPFYFIHASDTHVSLIDGRDSGDARLVDTAEKRFDFCPYAIRCLDELSLKANELDAFIVHTGDLIDYISQKNLDVAKNFTEKNDVFFCVGNHEYMNYVWNDLPGTAQRDKTFDTVQAVYPNDLMFSVRVEHGVKFIAVDNVYHRVEQWQVDKLREELAKDDMPVILALHVPLYAPDMFEFQMKKNGAGYPAWLMGVPEELMRESHYTEESIEEQKPDEPTNEFCDLVKSSPQIKAILTGHNHAHFVSQVTPTLKQYMVDTTEGQIFEIR